VAGLEPLTTLQQPSRNNVVAATKTLPKPAEPAVVWQTILPDRATSMTLQGNHILVHTLDGSVTTIDAQGKIVSQKAGSATHVQTPPAAELDGLPKEEMPTDRIAKFVAAAADATAVGYWGGTLQVFDNAGTVSAQKQLPQDIAAMAWHDENLIVGLADGRLLALKTGGS
jgi:hypothetical protein